LRFTLTIWSQPPNLELSPAPLGYVETGVVHKQIDLTVSFQYQVCHGPDVIRPGDIRRKGLDLPGVLFANALRGVSQHIEAASGNRNSPAVGGQGFCASKADATSTSGHPGDSLSLGHC
jgi:hypothetical protein